MPDIPTLATPADGTAFVNVPSVSLDWNAPASWGVECSGTATRQYNVCAGPSSYDPCAGTSNSVNDPTSVYAYVQNLPATYYWKVRAKNKAGNWGHWSLQRSFSMDWRGTIQARAMQVSASDTSCAAVRASGTGITGTVHQFSPSSASHPAPQTQSGSSYVVFNNLIVGPYTINSQAPVQYVLARACWSDSLSATSGEGFTQTLGAADTVTWDLGYTLGVAWSQVQGGDVYASGTLKSYVPVGAAPRAFIVNAAPNGYPGVATYGQSYTFDSSGLTHGQTWVSSKNWLVNDTSPATDFYQLMYRQFGGAPPAVDYVNPISPITQPAARATPYYVTGAMTTSGDWTVGSGQTLVFIVNGNLTIAGKITINAGGFAAFIVNGNITVAPAVASLDGIYITSPSGTFATGTGAVRFVGKGTYIAGNFLLQRDIGDAGNPTTPSELFIYNPQLWMTMPEQMKKLSVNWQEVTTQRIVTRKSAAGFRSKKRRYNVCTQFYIKEDCLWIYPRMRISRARLSPIPRRKSELPHTRLITAPQSSVACEATGMKKRNACSFFVPTTTTAVSLIHAGYCAWSSNTPPKA